MQLRVVAARWLFRANASSIISKYPKHSSWELLCNGEAGKFGINSMSSDDTEGARYTVKPGLLACVGA